jgi:hypothetical protein
MKTWIDITEQQYAACHCSAVTGGSTWLHSPEYPDAALVAHGTYPMEIANMFRSRPDNTLRVEVFRTITRGRVTEASR